MTSHYDLTIEDLFRILDTTGHISINAMDRSVIQEDCIELLHILQEMINRGINE